MKGVSCNIRLRIVHEGGIIIMRVNIVDEGGIKHYEFDDS